MDTPEFSSANEVAEVEADPRGTSTTGAASVATIGVVDLYHGNDSILVAVNGRQSGWQALDWAAAESSARGAQLRILHVNKTPLISFDPLCTVALNLNDTRAADTGRRILAEASERAGSIAPDIVITTHLDVGGIARTILRAGRHDALIVIGRGHPKLFDRWAVSWRTTRRARGPVAIVRLEHDRSGGPSAGRVVVGIDAVTGATPALTYAFQAASSRDTALTVIHACSLASPLGLSTSKLGFDIEDLRRLAAIDDTIHAYRTAFPDVEVHRHFVGGAAGRALEAESVGAALVVIGSRPNSWRHRTSQRSTARDGFRRAQSPIAIVPTLPTSIQHPGGTKP